MAFWLYFSITLLCFLEHCLKLFSLWKLLKLMFVDFKLSIIQTEVNDYLISLYDLVFQFSVAHFYSLKAG